MLLLPIFAALQTGRPVATTEPAVIPVGYDAFRMWERWPVLRVGERAYMRSTYDRSGGNEGADASHFLYQARDDFNVSLDVQGSGVLSFVRTNHWHGSPWHYEVDGRDHVMQESSTADPEHPRPGSIFLPPGLFVKPLAWTWSDTRGADLNWTPVPFERSFRMAYGRTHYGTGYYIFKQFVPGARLSQPIKAWSGKSGPPADVLKLIGRAGADLVPHEGTPEGTRAGIKEVFGGTVLARNGRAVIADLSQGPAQVRAIELSIPRDAALDFGRCGLRISWDGRRPSVDVPIALFFGAASLYNRDGREWLVKAFPVSIRYDKERVSLACFFPMPFFRSARIELFGNGQTAVSGIRYRLRWAPWRVPASQTGYFHATYRDIPAPEVGRDLVLLDTRGEEGQDEWSGHLVGTSFIFSHRANLGTLEGDPRFFFDDSQTPQAQGTGTEEWGGGGDYWGGLNMTLPFAGHPSGAKSQEEVKETEDRLESAYRFLLADLMPFGRNARIQLEHGGTNQSSEHYETISYWYGRPSPSLLKTDVLRVGDDESEQAHAYRSPQASARYEITSRYEWGVDTVNGHEVFPATKDIGRTTTGTSEFELKLTPDNWGVMLRRKLDHQYPNQRAVVEVRDAKGKWQPAGVWYTAGSNTCVYSNPRGELDGPQHVVQTSNRRFRDDEFLIGRALTRGRKSIGVRVRFAPVNTPLFPGRPLDPLAWSEIQYTAYCFVTPK